MDLFFYIYGKNFYTMFLQVHIGKQTCDNAPVLVRGIYGTGLTHIPNAFIP